MKNKDFPLPNMALDDSRAAANEAAHKRRTSWGLREC